MVDGVNFDDRRQCLCLDLDPSKALKFLRYEKHPGLVMVLKLVVNGKISDVAV